MTVDKSEKRKRWLVTGASGMLGRDVVARLEADPERYEVVGLGRGALDITDWAACEAALVGFDVVVNCAAYTAVDEAEDHFDEAFDVNAVGAANLARAAALCGARLVQLSTDYVFGGHATQPYLADHVMRPVSAYGRSKAAGEWAVMAAHADHLVMRTAWLYGEHGTSFPRTIARVARERGRVDVVDDQVGQPTWTVDVADLAVRLIEADAPGGAYAATSAGETSWFGFAQQVVAAGGIDAEVRPSSSAASDRPAPRPAYSAMSHDTLLQAGVRPIGPWSERWAVAASCIVGTSA